VRGGALFGGAGGPLENYVGEITKHVIRKAPCRVILTAPPADWRPRSPMPPAEGAGPPADGVAPPADGDGTVAPAPHSG
jgi:APA family basic amino acid/polyamine antiporter